MKFLVKVYIISFIIIVIYNYIFAHVYMTFSEASKCLYPLLGCYLIYLFQKYFTRGYIFSYFLFFLTSITMVFNLTLSMTGNYAGTSNTFLFGLSFYSLSMAYKAYIDRITLKDVIINANPLILFTGPIAIFFKHLTKTSYSRRFKIFFPYLIIGIFFSQIISSPLKNFFPLIHETNTPLVIIYGIIFEVFMYFNFAGLSLIIYAIFGILGVSIPLNFRQPFSSRNLIEFWRGWHTSLSNVLKELYYQPIRKKFNSTIAIIFVFVCSGLWHGMTLNFIIWSSFHALCYIITKVFHKKGYKYLTIIIMILAIPLGRIIFLDNDTQRLMIKLSFSDFTFNYLALSQFGLHNYLSLLIGLAIILLEFTFVKRGHFKQKNYKFLRTPMIQLVLFFLILFLISSSDGSNYAAYGQR